MLAYVTLNYALIRNSSTTFSLNFILNIVTERVSAYREAYATNFLTSVSFWSEWLSQNPSKELFDKALNHCPHFELAIKCIKYSISLMDNDKMVRHFSQHLLFIVDFHFIYK
jgi:hypothetical protein